MVASLRSKMFLILTIDVQKFIGGEGTSRTASGDRSNPVLNVLPPFSGDTDLSELVGGDKWVTVSAEFSTASED